MAYWLVKSEPGSYSFEDLERDRVTVWDGVRNNAAALHLKAMRQGDLVLFYHSREGLCVVGLARVSREAFPDPKDPGGRFVAVELEPERRLAHPVTLARMKGEPDLAGLAMLRQSRLSVSPVAPKEWAAIVRLSEDASDETG